MKRIVWMILTLIFIVDLNSYALETNLMNIRNKVLMESQDIKALLSDTKDVILVSSLWDSCVLTISQLDAYFFQLGIFNTIRKEEVTDTAVDFLIKWLNEIKKTNDLNIESLNSVNQKIEAKIKFRVEKLKGYYTDLNTQIDEELVKLSFLKSAQALK